jgi:hypothetical protein
VAHIGPPLTRGESGSRPGGRSTGVYAPLAPAPKDEWLSTARRLHAALAGQTALVPDAPVEALVGRVRPPRRGLTAPHHGLAIDPERVTNEGRAPAVRRSIARKPWNLTLDHTLYCQPEPGWDHRVLERWTKNNRPAARYVAVSKTRGLLDPDTHLFRLRIRGHRQNVDTWVSVNATYPAEFRRPGESDQRHGLRKWSPTQPLPRAPEGGQVVPVRQRTGLAGEAGSVLLLITSRRFLASVVSISMSV